MVSVPMALWFTLPTTPTTVIHGDRLAGMTNAEAGHEEGSILVRLAERLRADGHATPNVTAGGSVTGPGVAEVPGVTEVRAGTYVFADAMQVAAGSARPEDVALSILVTVISPAGPGGRPWTPGRRRSAATGAGLPRASTSMRS